jgi:serine/threonine protein kinase/tetratricopeptide (TPR) repeat protein
MSDSARWQRIKELFRQSQLEAESERESWLAAQCGDDADLLREIHGLLLAQRAAPGILANGAAAAITQLRSDERPPDLVGQRFGAYRLLRLIGEGGMGSVYLAERDEGEFLQRIALKLVRADFLSDEARVRFLRERRILAQLTHPHIAQLHDGGVANGMPYFTLEFVEGEPITAYCDGRKLDIGKRLQLVLQVCAAVAYAHRNLIVHRDLKPSNIFVTLDGEVKLLDFGIAKLLDAQGDAGQTATQARMMTPEYAAPEQVLGEPITTATDVYAIGVLIYELLSGRLPYARADAGAISWSKAVVEETPEPVYRALSRPASRAAKPTGDAAAAVRGVPLANLRRSLRGDLDRILQRALAKAPEARYATVGSLAADVGAYLAGQAISGGTRTYQMRKFVRRHWLPLAAAAAIVMVLIGSGVAMIWQSRQIAREAQNTLQVKDFLFGLFTAVDPRYSKGRDVSAHELLDRGAQRIERNKLLDPQQRAEIESVLGRIYYSLGVFDRASSLQESAIQALSADPSRRLLLAQTQAERADTLIELGDTKSAVLLADAATHHIEQLPQAPLADRIRVLHAHVRVALAQRDFAAAKRYSDAELALVRQTGVAPRVLYDALASAGGARWGLADFGGAEAYFRDALAVASGDAAGDELAVSRAQTNLAMTMQATSRYVEAMPLTQQAAATEERILGLDHPTTLTTRRDLGLAYYHLGLYAQARTTLEQVLAAQRAKLGNENPALAGTEINLGLVLIDSGDLAQALSILGEALNIFEKKNGREYAGTRIALGNIAVAHMLSGDLDRAEAELDEVRAQENKPDFTDPEGYITLYRLGEVKRRRGDAAAAVALETKAVDDARKHRGENNRYTAMAHHLLGLALRDVGDARGAERELRAALASYAGYIPGAEHPLAAATRHELGVLLVQRDADRAEGIRLLGEAVALREKFLGKDEPRTRQTRVALAEAQSLAKR